LFPVRIESSLSVRYPCKEWRTLQN
jgi:hypothetical protein